MECTGTDLEVVRLHDEATLFSPVRLEVLDEILKMQRTGPLARHCDTG